MFELCRILISVSLSWPEPPSHALSLTSSPTGTTGRKLYNTNAKTLCQESVWTDSDGVWRITFSICSQTVKLKLKDLCTFYHLCSSVQLLLAFSFGFKATVPGSASVFPPRAPTIKHYSAYWLTDTYQHDTVEVCRLNYRVFLLLLHCLPFPASTTEHVM